MNVDDQLYHYRAELERVIDGDTVVLRIDLGFRTMTTPVSCRLIGIDAPEVRTRDPEEKRRGMDALHYLIDLLGWADELIVKSERIDGFGRPLVTLYALHDGEWVIVNDTLVAQGFAEASE